MTVLGLTIVAMIMLIIGSQTMGSLFSSRQKQEKSTGMAAADSGIEMIRLALQSGLADETDGFALTREDLETLIANDPESTAEVIANSSAWALTPALVTDPDQQFTVREAARDSYRYWQVFNVIPPRYAPGRSSNVVYFVRAWAMAKDEATMTTSPKVFRVEFRPGLFSDYQFVSDAPFWVYNNTSYVINGPIHSNGYDPDAAFVSYSPDDPLDPIQGHGIYVDAPRNCTGRARFSTSQGKPITVKGSDSTCIEAAADGQTNARQVSLLGVNKVLERIRERCGAIGVYCDPYKNSPQPLTDIRLAGDQVQVDGATVAASRWQVTPGDSRALTILVAGDVRIRGSIDSSGSGEVLRVTIANMRHESLDRSPNVLLAADGGNKVVGVANGTGSGNNDMRDSVGVITEGNIILPMPATGQGDCLRTVRMAAIASTGGVTIPPEWVLKDAPPVSTLDGWECNADLALEGSFATHGQFVASMGWGTSTGKKDVGYPSVGMVYEQRLYSVPPPFYPTTLPWGITKVGDADSRCLVASERANPFCGEGAS